MSDYIEGTIDDITRELGKTYEELLDELRRDGHGINFDVSEVPAEHYDAHTLAGFELTCTIQMMDPSFRAALCLHEAAHAEYTEQMDPTLSITIKPPFAWYKNGELKYSNAATTDSGNDGTINVTEENILAYIKSIVAAGIAEEVMVGKPTDGTGHDEAALEELFVGVEATPEERTQLLKQARADILKDLRSPAFRKKLWARAKSFQHILERGLWATPQAEVTAA